MCLWPRREELQSEHQAFVYNERLDSKFDLTLVMIAMLM